jgi:hypothetical protein
VHLTYQTSRFFSSLGRNGLRVHALVLALFFGATSSSSQQTSERPSPLPYRSREWIITAGSPDSLLLERQFIAANTDTLITENGEVLKRFRDYAIDYRHGIVRLDTTRRKQIVGDTGTPPKRIRVSFRYFPFTFQDTYARRRLILMPDSTAKEDSLRIARPSAALSVDDIFGKGLQKSGSIVRGFTVGTNQDLSLTSGLRLQLAGKILSDLEIAASLTDENTPIQPEGTTQTLQEFDKVFIEMKGPSFSATLGDFALDLPGTRFALLNRKVQGARGTIDYQMGSASGSTTIAGAITRGKFITKQFTGIEGVQGPYLLTGANNERAIIVIAGTERVYIDGEVQTRGELNDYTIDYSVGQITFTARRLITSASRIVVDYEYTDRQYSRSLFVVRQTAGAFDDKARLLVTYTREADDPDAPIDFVMTDSARAALAAAGPDPSKAVLSGVTRVDSNGTYMQIDTVLDGGSTTRFYRYAPGDPQALYIVVFSYVGPGNGEYVRQRAGMFVWQGSGAGDYLPIRLLPLPQSHQLLDVSLDASPSKEVRVTGELANSIFNANRLSSVPGTERTGYAYWVGAAVSPRAMRLAGVELGNLDLLIKRRYQHANFLPIDRANEIEFGRKWGVDTLDQTEEQLTEAAITYVPVGAVQIGGGYGSLERGSIQRSDRYEGNMRVTFQDLPGASYSFEDISSSDARADINNTWFRQKANIDYRIGVLTSGLRYENERRDFSGLSSGTLQSGSFEFDAISATLNVQQLGKLSLGAEFAWRNDDQFYSGAVIPESKSFSQIYTARLAEWNALSSSLDLTLRSKNYSTEFRLAGNNNVQTVLIRNQTRYAPLNRGVETDLFYQVGTELSSRLERVYVRVAPGSGSYRYLGDLNGNGIADDQEFVPTRFDGDFIAITVPSDQLVPVIELKTSARLRLTPRRFLSQGDSWLTSLLTPLSAETYLRIEEKSTDPDLPQIYLLHLGSFLQDATTIAGSQVITQDLNVFEGDPSFSARLRFTERHNLGNYSGGVERGYGRERSVRLRWQLVAEVSNQLDLVMRDDRLTGSQTAGRQRNIASNALTFDVSYRPEQNLELGWKIDLSRSIDSYPTPQLQGDLNAQAIRLVYALQGTGQVRVEFSREEVVLGRMTDVFPFELTGGRVPGKTWIWRTDFDYRATNFLQATLHYDGRVEGGAPPVHTARAEVRAFF